MASFLTARCVAADLRRLLRRAVKRLAVRRAKLPPRVSASHVFSLAVLLLLLTLTLSPWSSSPSSSSPSPSSPSSSWLHSSPLFLRPQPQPQSQLRATASADEQRVQLMSVLTPSTAAASFPSDAEPPLGTALPPPLRARVDQVLARTACAHSALSTLYHVPTQVARCMTRRVARALLWKLVLTDMVAQPHARHVYARARVLFVHTQNGLGNRLRALASGLAMARATARVPVVVWEQDPHLAAPFEEVLNAQRNASQLQGVLYHHLIVMHRFLNWQDAAQRNRTWHGVSYMEKDGRDAEPGILMRFQMPAATHASVNSWISFAQQYPQLLNGSAQLSLLQPPPAAAPHQRQPPSPHLIHSGKHVYFKSAYVAKTEPGSMCSRSVVNRELALLTPSDAVLQIVRQLDADTLRRAIGVHVRSRSLARDNVHVRTRCEYTRVGARVTDYWRSRSSLNVFVHKMQWAVRRQKSVKFFVASDDMDVVSTLRQKFGKDRILRVERGCDDRLEGCVKYAMADLICLAKTRKIYGSNWSSFSEAAGRLGGKKVYLSGYHFGRLKGFERRWDKFQSRFYSTVDHIMSLWPSWLALPWNWC